MDETNYEDVGLTGADAPRPEPRPTLFTDLSGNQRIDLGSNGQLIMTKAGFNSSVAFIGIAALLFIFAISRR